MSFHSLEFAVFFAIVVAVYYLIPFARRVPVLLAASLLFYLSFAAQNIYVLAGLIVASFALGHAIERAPSQGVRKFWLVTALAIDLGLMAAFKYGPEVVGKSFGAIPIGLSFHTFQAMAYAIDIYRGSQPAGLVLALLRQQLDLLRLAHQVARQIAPRGHRASKARRRDRQQR